MATTRKVEFPTPDGLTLRGILYSAGENRPCIILTQGFSGLKEQFLPDYAERFVKAGYTALTYDNRNWGESDGLPRNESDPLKQFRDYHTAFDFAASLPEVDASKIVYWGSSMSGGNAIMASAVDHRICGVIAQVPFVSGEAIASVMGDLVNGILAQRSHLIGKEPAMIPVNPASVEELESGQARSILQDASVFPFLAELDRRGQSHEKLASSQSVYYLFTNEPSSFIHRIAPTPLLMVVASNDTCCPTPLQLQAFEKAKEPKELKVIEGATHFSPYYGTDFEKNVETQLEFLARILK